MSERMIMDSEGMRRTIVRLSHEIAERNENLDGIVLVGIRRGGEIVAKRIGEALKRSEGKSPPCYGIDIGLQRDDLVSAFFLPRYAETEPTFAVEGKTAVLCDDVLHTGRSVRAAIETIFRRGRSKSIQLLELVDRGGRELPVRADYVGKNVPTARSEYVEAYFTELGATEDKIVIGRKEPTEGEIR